MQQPSKNDLWFLPLGGSGEIGMNLNLYAHDNQWLMVDLGVTFADQYGIEIITPDIEFIHERKKQLKGLIITHAHEDHIGAIPYLWPYLRCPVYLTSFSAQVLRNKLEDYPWKSEVPIYEIEPNSEISVGKFNINFVQLTHSIPEPQALLIQVADKRIFHTGDWKIDPKPITGAGFNEKYLKEIGDTGIDFLVCDSTNVFEPGSTGSESDVDIELTAEISKHVGRRVIVTCFASNIARLQTLFNAAQKTNRDVCLIGRSLNRMVTIAQECGYLTNAPNIIDPQDFDKIPRERTLLITTGSQGEARSGLARIANMSHQSVRLDSGDVVIFSSRKIPGNEKSISHMQNQLVLQGIKIIVSKNDDLHVSGHPSQDELRKMYDLIRPKTLIPVHGEAMHLNRHAAFAKENGINKACIPHNGSLIDLKSDSAPQIIDKVQAGRFVYDGKRMVPSNCNSIAERKRLSFNGAASISIILNKNYTLKSTPILQTLGILEPDEIPIIEKRALHIIDNVLLDDQLTRDELAEKLRIAIRKIFKSQFDKKPTVQVHLHVI